MTKLASKKLGDVLAFGKNSLSKVSDSASLDAQVLMSFVLDKNRAWLLAHPENILTDQQFTKFNNFLLRLENGDALPYLLGEWEFFGLSFYVSPDVLIPRPETEMLVETVLKWLDKREEPLALVDVGTGSGIIPICVASRTKNINITAVDISLPALKVAKRNAARHDVTNCIEFLQNNLLSNIDKKFDIITANLPYIPTETLKDLAVNKTEPSLALDGGEDGLDLIHQLLKQANERLNHGGMIILEIEYRQGSKVLAMGKKYFPMADVNTLQDLAGHDRFVMIQT